MLNQEQFKLDLKSVYKEMQNYTGDEEKALDTFCDKMAGVFIKHIKTLEITYTNGLSAGSNLVIGTFNNTLK